MPWMLSGYQKLGVARVDEQRVSGGANMPNGGFIKLHRSILDWEWYGDRNVMCMYLHLLLTANTAAEDHYITVINRGQIMATIDRLVCDVGLKPNEVKTALKKLQKTGYIEVSRVSAFMVITVLNYDSIVNGELCFNPSEGKPRWRERSIPGYEKWRRAVLRRDKYTCQNCGKTNCVLHVHHIKSFAQYPELRLTVRNGITLCRECHIHKHRTEGK